MPWIRTDISPTAGRGLAKWKRMLVIQCDGCGVEFPRKFKLAKNMAKCAHTYCTYTCQRNAQWADPAYAAAIGPAMRGAWKRDGVRERHATALAAAQASPEYRKHLSEGVLRSYADPDRLRAAAAQLAATRADPTVRAKKSKSLKETWGTPELRAAKAAFFKERWCDPDFRKAVTSASKKQAATPAAKRVRAAASTALWAAKTTDEKRAVSAKRAVSSRMSGKANTSKPEGRLYDYLSASFGDNDVERFAPLQGWHMDFYIKSIETYVQLDGVYWHGIDRPIIEIAEMRTAQDVGIFRTYCKDIERVRHCRENNIRLIRITDLELAAKERSGLVADWIAAEVKIPELRDERNDPCELRAPHEVGRCRAP